MDNVKKFSIIICTYNVAGLLPKTLNSLLHQTIDDFEIIIIDGKSKDDTIQIITDYAKKFGEKLKWISEKDSGVYNAMNKGLKMASGEYINIIGAGDWLEEDALEQAGKCISKNPFVDAVYGVTRVWEKDMGKSRLKQTLPHMLPAHPMQHPSIFIKKTLHEKFGFYDESYRIAADYAFCLKVFYKSGISLACFDFVVDNFVMGGLSSTNQIKTFRENKRALAEVGLKYDGFLRQIVTYYKKKLFT